MSIHKRFMRVFTLFSILLLGILACRKSGYSSLGGMVTGLSGDLVLQSNSGETITISKNGSFEFTQPIASGSTYSVTVLRNPPGQTCSVANARRVIRGVSSMTLFITCSASSATYTVGGSVSGLSGTVVLQNNLGDDLTLTNNGEFTFATVLANQAPYSVTVKTQPAGQVCSVSSGSGTVSSAAVTNVNVSCSTSTYTVGGSVSGLSGTVVLQNNSGDDLTITTDGPFTFATEVAHSAGYSVTVLTQPSGQVCTVTHGSGTISASVSDVSVSCVIPTYTVGGTVSGLSTGSLVLQNNGGDNLTLTSNGAFTFATGLTNSTAYSVTVLTQPTGLRCTLSNASGTISSANVTSVSVSCVSALRIFVTNSTHNAVYGGTAAAAIAAADAICMADANYPGSGTYKAMLANTSRRACSSSNCSSAGVSEHIDWVLAPNMLYTRPDGTAIGSTNSLGLLEFPLTNSFKAGSLSDLVWIGLESGWVTSSHTCSNWTSMSGTAYTGRYDTTTSSSIFYLLPPGCFINYRLYCVEQ